MVIFLMEDLDTKRIVVNRSSYRKPLSEISVNRLIYSFLLIVIFSSISSCNQSEKADKDIILPEVSVSSPASSIDITDGVIFSAYATDNAAIQKVCFYIDGELVSEDYESPYELDVSSFEQFSFGLHTLLASAVDTSRNIDFSDPIIINTYESGRVDISGDINMNLDKIYPLWSMGASACGELGNPNYSANVTSLIPVLGISEVKSISVSGCTSMALKDDGTVWEWGYIFDDGIYGDGKNWNSVVSRNISKSRKKSAQYQLEGITL